jgi:uncharacterized protein (TIGR03437 family)
MTFLRVVLLLVLASLPVLAQPAVSGVANAASFIPAGLPNGNIAAGSMFVIFGTGLGPDTLTQVSAFPLPTNLAGTRVHINTASAAGQADAYMIYSSATQVAAILPSSLNFNGNVDFTVTYNGRTSNSVFVRLTTSSFGAFTLSQSGLGAAVAQNYNSPEDTPFNGWETPAKPGQLVILWGTGLGPVSGPEANQPLPGQLQLSLQVYVGGKLAQLSYYGRSGCCSGIDQVVFAVPAGVMGCTVPVVVVINGIPSNVTSIAVSPDGGLCSDPLGLSSSDLQTAIQTGAARIATISLTHSDGGNPPDSGSASFTTTPLLQYARGLSGASAAGSCLLINGSGNASLPSSGAAPLDAGASVQVSGPTGSGQLAKQSNGGYTGVLPPIQAGAYTISGNGGADVGPFTASMNVGPPIVWTNRTAITSITPGSPVTVSWTAGDPNAFVSIEGLAVNQSTKLFGIFECTERASANSFQIPGYITAGLPAGQGGIGLVETGTPARFSAQGVSQGFVTYITGSAAGPFTVGASGGGTKQ